MTGDLIPLHETLPLRIITSPIGPVIPAIDIADALGYDRSTITRIVKANEDIFKGMQVFQPLSTRGGTQQFLCLNKVGTDRILYLIKPSRKREVFERFEKFRERAFERLADQKKEIVQIVSIEGIKSELQQAKEYAGVCERDVGSFQAAVFKKYGMTEFADVLRPAHTHGETGWYNPTRLVNLCNDPDLTPERLNWYLKNKGFQYRDGYIWRLTPAGLIHGREYNFEAPSGHCEIRIAWRESILYASGLKRPTDQAALPAKAGAGSS
jgi:hypothetical protein